MTMTYLHPTKGYRTILMEINGRRRGAGDIRPGAHATLRKIDPIPPGQYMDEERAARHKHARQR